MIKKTPKGWIVIDYDGHKLGTYLTIGEAKQVLESYEKGRPKWQDSGKRELVN
jgi:hypothetical protein